MATSHVIDTKFLSKYVFFKQTTPKLVYYSPARISIAAMHLSEYSIYFNLYTPL